MKLDDLTALNSPIHRWEPKTKLIGFLILIFTISFIDRLVLLPATIIVTAILFALSKIPFKYLLNRMRLPAFFLAVVGIMLIFFSEGVSIFELGPIRITKEGFEAFLIISVRFFSIIVLVIVLFGTTQFAKLIKVLRSFGISTILVDMTMFTYRYLFEIVDQLENMQIAMKLRGFNKRNLKSIPKYVSLIGTIFIRSYEQSERVYNAMITRGYGEAAYFHNDFEIKSYDVIWLISIIVISLILILAQILLRQLGV